MCCQMSAYMTAAVLGLPHQANTAPADEQRPQHHHHPARGVYAGGGVLAPHNTAKSGCVKWTRTQHEPTSNTCPSMLGQVKHTSAHAHTSHTCMHTCLYAAHVLLLACINPLFNSGACRCGCHPVGSSHCLQCRNCNNYTAMERASSR
jgi:hypothetical protein